MAQFPRLRLVFGSFLLPTALLLSQFEAFAFERLDEESLRSHRGAEGSSAKDEDYTCDKASVAAFNAHLPPQDHWVTESDCAGNNGSTCLDCNLDVSGEILNDDEVPQGYAMPFTSNCQVPPGFPLGTYGTCINGECEEPFYQIDCTGTVDTHLVQEIGGPIIVE
jgi:hypothetical protein